MVAQAQDPAAAYTEFFAGAAAVLEESDFIDPCPIGSIAREVANTSEPLRIAAEAVFNSWVDAAVEHLTGVGVGAEDARQLAQVFVATVEGMFVLSRTLRSAGAVLSRLVTEAIGATTRT